MTMDVRRVQITGGSSFMITLPKEWANTVGLKKNDSVGLQTQSDGSLSLYPSGTAPEVKRTTKTIDVTNITDRGFIYRQLVGAYIAGHATIMVVSEHPLPSIVTSAVSSFVQTSIGLETMEADDNHIMISDLIEHDTIEPRKIVERMRILVRGMLTDAFEAAFTGNFDLIKDMESRDKEIDRVYWLTSRQCNIYQKDMNASRKMNLPLYDLTACLSVSRVLESIGDHAILMSKYLLLIAAEGSVYRIDKDAHKGGMRIVELLNMSVKSWVERDLALAEKAIEEANDIIREADKTLELNVKPHQTNAVREVMLVSSKRVAEYCKDISEYAFNIAME